METGGSLQGEDLLQFPGSSEIGLALGVSLLVSGCVTVFDVQAPEPCHRPSPLAPSTVQSMPPMRVLTIRHGSGQPEVSS